MKNTLCKRIIPCLDVDSSGRVVKGVKFQGLRDIGEPVELAARYQEEGADELMFLDIAASHEERDAILDVLHQVAKVLMIPFSVGGGIRSLDRALELLSCGADKVSVNSAAVSNPKLIEDIATECGSQCCILAIDARRNAANTAWEVLVKGGREVAKPDAVAWAKEAVDLGTGEILLTSWDKDGTREGFDLALTKAISEAVPVPVIASGGAKDPQSFIEVFSPAGQADAALAASIFHDREWHIADLKKVLTQAHLPIRH